MSTMAVMDASLESLGIGGSACFYSNGLGRKSLRNGTAMLHKPIKSSNSELQRGRARGLADRPGIRQRRRWRFRLTGGAEPGALPKYRKQPHAKYFAWYIRGHFSPKWRRQQKRQTRSILHYIGKADNDRSSRKI
jgi:hypothetical protein